MVLVVPAFLLIANGFLTACPTLIWPTAFTYMKLPQEKTISLPRIGLIHMGQPGLPMANGYTFFRIEHLIHWFTAHGGPVSLNHFMTKLPNCINMYAKLNGEIKWQEQM